MNDGTRPRWVDEIDASTTTLQVAAALGLTVRRHRFGPCPACNADDRRGVVTAYAIKWACRCGNGNLTQLAALVLTGSAKPSDWRPVRAWFAGQGWCSGDGASSYTPPPPRPPEPEVPYPDADELARFRAMLTPVGDDAEVAAYWGVRGFGGHTEAARALPRDGWRPGWWPYHAYRMVVPAYDTRGVMRSVHGRALGSRTPKTVWPKGCRSTGLLFADPDLGLWMLRGESVPERVLVVEGLTDYLALASLRLPGWAILGGTSGSFAALAHVPHLQRCAVYSGVDEDEAGEAYHRQIVRAVPHAVRLLAPGEDWAGVSIEARRATLSAVPGGAGMPRGSALKMGRPPVPGADTR